MTTSKVSEGTKEQSKGKRVSKTGIYTFAHGFAESTPLAHYVGEVAKMCERRGVIGEPAKMGVHLTLFPPFRANHENIRFASSCMKAMSAATRGWSASIVLSGVGYFPPPTEDSNIEALYLAVDLPRDYRDYIEWLKANNSFDWIFPPHQTSAVEPLYLPHIHVIEGVDIKQRLKKSAAILNGMTHGRTFDLRPPMFFRKVESKSGGKTITKWEQVVP